MSDQDETPEREVSEHMYRTSLKCWWSREFGWLSVLDPFTGEVTEVQWPHKDTPKWMVWRAMDEKHRRLLRRNQ